MILSIYSTKTTLNVFGLITHLGWLDEDGRIDGARDGRNDGTIDGISVNGR